MDQFKLLISELYPAAPRHNAGAAEPVGLVALVPAPSPARVDRSGQRPFQYSGPPTR